MRILAVLLIVMAVTVATAYVVGDTKIHAYSMNDGAADTTGSPAATADNPDLIKPVQTAEGAHTPHVIVPP